MIVKESVKGTNSLQIDTQAQDHSSSFKDYACFIHIKLIWKCEEKKRKEKRKWRDLSVSAQDFLGRPGGSCRGTDTRISGTEREPRHKPTRMCLTDSRERHRNNSEEEIQIFFFQKWC